MHWTDAAGATSHAATVTLSQARPTDPGRLRQQSASRCALIVACRGQPRRGAPVRRTSPCGAAPSCCSTASTGRSRRTSAGRCSGANGAGKTTLLQIAAAVMHPTSGEAYVFGERLGGVDVFELRPRIGLASSSIAAAHPERRAGHRCRGQRRVRGLGRWREAYGRLDVRRAASCSTGSASARWPSAPTARSARASGSGCRSRGR